MYEPIPTTEINAVLVDTPAIPLTDPVDAPIDVDPSADQALSDPWNTW